MKYRIVRQLTKAGFVFYVIQFQEDDGIDGLRWYPITAQYASLNEAKEAIKQFRNNEVITEKVVWTENERR